MTSRGLRRAFAFAATVVAVVAGASYVGLRDEGPAAVVERAVVTAATPPASSSVTAVVPNAAKVQQPGEDGVPADADTSAGPEVAGDFAEPTQVAPSAPVSYVQQSDGQYVVDGGPVTLVHKAQDAVEAAAGLEVPGQGYPAPVGPHVEVGDSPAPTGASSAYATAQQVPTEGVAPAPESLRSGAEPEVLGELPETAR